MVRAFSSSQIRFENKKEANLFLDTLKKTSTFIAGLDEVGRGVLSGPVVAACVLLPDDHSIKGIKDSKKLSSKRRDILATQIREVALGLGIGACNNEEVDELNIHQATLLAAKRAAEACVSEVAVDYILCDGGLELESLITVPTKSIIKGDVYIEAIAAASIVAKVFRDKQMSFYHELWPEYGFITNQGYGTEAHREAIIEHGITPIHRRTFGICREAKER
jgi:ribonuclease HII